MKKESRNGHAFHPIMRKGGVHEKTNKAKRKADRHQVARKVDGYFSKDGFLKDGFLKDEFEKGGFNKGGRKAVEDSTAPFYRTAA